MVASQPRKRPAKRVSAPRKGPNVRAVEAHVEALRRENQLDTHGEAVAAMAVRLAGLLDVGEPVMMTASWARELRQTLQALASKEVSSDVDADAWIDGLPS